MAESRPHTPPARRGIREEKPFLFAAFCPSLYYVFFNGEKVRSFYGFRVAWRDPGWGPWPSIRQARVSAPEGCGFNRRHHNRALFWTAVIDDTINIREVLFITFRKRVRGLWRHSVLRKPALARDGDWSEYYDSAEADVASQWLTIEAFLKELPQPDFSVVLDFACGRGRIAERFAGIAGRLTCADISVDAIAVCRQRFATRSNVECLVNGNGSIPVRSESITFLYSWDAMVHFDTRELNEYFAEFKRVLKPGGMGPG